MEMYLQNKKGKSMKKQSPLQAGMVGHIEILVAIVLVGVIGFAGWRIMSNDNAPSNTPQASVETQQDTTDLPSDLTNIKSIDEIQTLAAADVSGLTIVGVELEIEEGQPIYAVHFSDGSVISYNAKSGNKLQLQDNNNDDIDDSSSLPSGFIAGVTIQQAVNTAKQEMPNGAVRKVELEMEDNIVVYSVRFKDGSRVDINATDGTVVRTKQANSSNSNTSSGSGGSQNSGSSGSDSHDSDDDSSSSSSNDDRDDDSSTDTSNSTDDDDSSEDQSGSDSGGSNSGSGSSGGHHGSDDD